MAPHGNLGRVEWLSHINSQLADARRLIAAGDARVMRVAHFGAAPGSNPLTMYQLVDRAGRNAWIVNILGPHEALPAPSNVVPVTAAGKRKARCDDMDDGEDDAEPAPRAVRARRATVKQERPATPEATSDDDDDMATASCIASVAGPSQTLPLASSRPPRQLHRPKDMLARSDAAPASNAEPRHFAYPATAATTSRASSPAASDASLATLRPPHHHSSASPVHEWLERASGVAHIGLDAEPMQL